MIDYSSFYINRFLIEDRLRTLFRQSKLQIWFNEIIICISRRCCLCKTRKEEELCKIENQIIYVNKRMRILTLTIFYIYWLFTLKTLFKLNNTIFWYLYDDGTNQVSILYECSLLIEWDTRFWLIASDDLYVESVNHVTHANSIRSDYLSTSLSRLIKPFVHTQQSLEKW